MLFSYFSGLQLLHSSQLKIQIFLRTYTKFTVLQTNYIKNSKTNLSPESMFLQAIKQKVKEMVKFRSSSMNLLEASLLQCSSIDQQLTQKCFNIKNLPKKKKRKGPGGSFPENGWKCISHTVYREADDRKSSRKSKGV